MNDDMCEKCKYKDVSTFRTPCLTCKYSFLRGTSQFDNSASFFEPENAEDAEREEIECIDAMLETMGWADVRTFCLAAHFNPFGRAKRSTRHPRRTWKKPFGTWKSTLSLAATYEAGLLGELAAPGEPQKGPF